jgi:hypothetical protein
MVRRRVAATFTNGLNVFPALLPPLRAKREDMHDLVGHFVERFGRRMGKTVEHIPVDTMFTLTPERASWFHAGVRGTSLPSINPGIASISPLPVPKGYIPMGPMPSSKHNPMSMGLPTERIDRCRRRLLTARLLIIQLTSIAVPGQPDWSLDNETTWIELVMSLRGGASNEIPALVADGPKA